MQVQTNFSFPNASLDTFTEDDRHLLLVVSLPGDHGTEPMTTQSLAVYLTSQAGNSIAAVLLEHSPCAGGIFVLLSDKASRRRWDVCSTWHAPGPAFITSSNEVEIIVELNEATDPCTFNISAMAVVKPPGRKLELWNLSATEGKFLVEVVDWSVC